MTIIYCTCSSDDLYPSLSSRTHNSSLDGAMKLKLCHSAPLEMLFPMVSFFSKVKISRLWSKTMDYSQAFCLKLSSFFVLLLLLTGRCTHTHTHTPLLPPRVLAPQAADLGLL